LARKTRADSQETKKIQHPNEDEEQWVRIEGIYVERSWNDDGTVELLLVLHQTVHSKVFDSIKINVMNAIINSINDLTCKGFNRL